MGICTSGGAAAKCTDVLVLHDEILAVEPVSQSSIPRRESF